LLSAAFQGAEHAELELQEVLPPGRAAAPTQAARPAMPEAVRPDAARPEAPKRTSLFSRVFGGAPSPNAAPAGRAAHQEPVINAANYRQEPAVADLHAQHEPQREPARAAVRPAQVDEIGLEIPAFLRRSSN
jgi:cell division protein FtsZ